MDKRQLQTFSVWAKENLEQQIEVSLKSLGINSASDIKAAHRAGEVTVIDGDPNSYPADLFSRRESIVRLMREKGYQHIIEEFAYTWFNRLVALRFMEVHNYLPHGFRVLSSTTGSVEPDILRNLPLVKDELHLDIALCTRLKEQNETEALFRYVLLKQCANLSEILPMLFEGSMEDMSLLLPKSLLIGDTVLTRLVAIPEENFLDDVQIVGWLYQYYNTEPNARVYDGNMSKERVPKELLPAATTLYTPDWAVRYMAENSLGRLWLEGHPNETLQKSWKYYLLEAEQTEITQHELNLLHNEYASIRPDQILCLDCCAGSGHILVYMFEMLMQIYESYGYSKREAVASIVQNNLWGLDIDDRAAQLANFAVMMKARQYDRGWFQRGILPHVIAIQESNNINRNHLQFIGNGLNMMERNIASAQIQALLDEFIDAKEYGSILQTNGYDWDLLHRALKLTKPADQISMDESGIENTIQQITQLINQGEALVRKYHIVITNPPYLGSSRFSPKLSDYVKGNYPDEKQDLSIVMFRKAMDSFVKEHGFIAFITTNSWMFLSSFEKTRNALYKQSAITTLVDFGTELFEGKVGHNPIVSWVTRATKLEYNMTAVRLVDYCYSRRDQKEPQFFMQHNRYTAQQDKFIKIPGAPVAYWVSKQMLHLFEGKKASDYGDAKSGMTTTDNSRFLRFWFEPNWDAIGFGYTSLEQTEDKKYKWFPFTKGGDFRRWYGNQSYIVNWLDNGKEIRKAAQGATGGRLVNIDCALSECIVWTKISSASISLRYKGAGIFFSDAAPGFFTDNHTDLLYMLALLNTKFAQKAIDLINPTLNYVPGAIASVPVYNKKERIESIIKITEECISLSRTDWNSFETSWDFHRHPLIEYMQVEERESASIATTPNGEEMVPTVELCIRLETAYHEWEQIARERFEQLKADEEELNRIFIDIYGLQDELTPEVADEDVTVRLADKQRDIRSLISYLVGVVMGRYSLDIPGLAYAGGNWDGSKYVTYQPDDDGIVPIYRGIGMDDGLTARLIKLIKHIYGEESYRENMEFIADALGKKTNESAEETLNRYLNDGFFADHLKVYQKRPIYWLFTSGKNGGFKCLIYMHRYSQDTLARINGKYFLPESTRLKHDLEDIDQRLNVADGSERVRLEKERQRLMACYQEALAYGQVLDHMANKYIAIDLDDGVKVNYAKFQGVEMVTDGGSKVKMDLLAPLK